MGFFSLVAFIFKNLAISFAQAVFIKAKPFALILIKAVVLTPYLFQNTVYGTVKCFPFIN